MGLIIVPASDHSGEEQMGFRRNTWMSSLLLFSHSVMSNYLWTERLHHTRLPCPSLSPGAWSNSCPSSQWYHPTISSSVTPFSSCPQSFPPIRVFSTSGGQSIGASVSASSLLMNILKLISFRICSSCQFPSCKYSHYDQFQAANMTSQNRELGKDAQWHPSTWYLHHTGYCTCIV